MSASTVSSRPTQRRPVERRNAAVPTRRVTPRPRPRVRSVPQPASARRAPFLILVVSLLGAGLLGMLALNTALAQGSFRVSDLQRQVAALDDQQQALQQRAAVLAAPQRLARRAGALGMVPMELPAFLRASDGKVLGRPQPASGAGTTATAGTSSTTSSSTAASARRSAARKPPSSSGAASWIRTTATPPSPSP